MAMDPMNDIGRVFAPLMFWGILFLTVGAIVLAMKLWITTRVNEGRALEQELNALYMKCQNYLFSSELILKEISGLESGEADRVAQILSQVIQARNANVGVSNLPIFLYENYPDLRNLGIPYDHLASQIISRREGFQRYQEQLADKISEFEKWRTATLRGILFAQDFPDDKLEAVINGEVVAVGSAALGKMKQLISNQATNAAYHSGLYEGYGR